jgi:ribosomal protein L7/L12
MRGKAGADGVISEDQYEEIEKMLKENRFLMAVKLYKEYADVGLYDAKNYISNLRDSLKLNV